jgi:hypothetical protein
LKIKEGKEMEKGQESKEEIDKEKGKDIHKVCSRES